MNSALQNVQVDSPQGWASIGFCCAFRLYLIVAINYIINRCNYLIWAQSCPRLDSARHRQLIKQARGFNYIIIWGILVGEPATSIERKRVGNWSQLQGSQPFRVLQRQIREIPNYQLMLQPIRGRCINVRQNPKIDPCIGGFARCWNNDEVGEISAFLL